VDKSEIWFSVNFFIVYSPARIICYSADDGKTSDKMPENIKVYISKIWQDQQKMDKIADWRKNGKGSDLNGLLFNAMLYRSEMYRESGFCRINVLCRADPMHAS
jgi:hypothetical protein